MDRMQARFDVVEVHPDCARHQLCSRVANGKMYDDAEVCVIAAVPKGFDITEVFSPQRATKLCAKYGLMAGDDFKLRDSYDLFR